MGSRWGLGVLVAVLALGLGALYFRLRSPRGGERAATEPSEATAQTRAFVEPLAAAKPSESAPRPGSEPASAKAPLDDEQAMQQLRDLLALEPARALERARQQLRESPAGPNAAERAWIVVRALDQLGRHREAQLEARAMLARYPNNRWTDDAERHTLVYPLDQPSREQQQLLPAKDAQGHDEAEQRPR